MNGYEFKFHIPTNYIHIRSTAEALNLEKYHNQNRFWKDKDTQEFMDEINSDVIKYLKLGYFSKIQIYQSLSNMTENMTERITSEETDVNLLECANENIIKQLKIHPCYFDLNKGCPREIIGRYVHSDLFIFALMWMKNNIGIQIANIFTRMNPELSKNNEYVSKLEYEINGLDKQIKELEMKKTELETKLQKTNSLNGSIKLSFSDNELKLHHENYNQVQGVKDFVIQNVFDSKSKRDKIYHFVKEHRSNF